MNNKTKEILMKYVIPFVLIAGGIMWLFLCGKSVLAKVEWTEVTAVVTNVDEEYDITENRTEYTVTVSYKVDGKEYTTHLDEPKNYDIGTEVTIRYNPENPEETNSTSIFGSIMLLLVGAGVLVLGIVMVKQTFAYNAKQKNQ